MLHDQPEVRAEIRSRSKQLNMKQAEVQKTTKRKNLNNLIISQRWYTANKLVSYLHRHCGFQWAWRIILVISPGIDLFQKQKLYTTWENLQSSQPTFQLEGPFVYISLHPLHCKVKRQNIQPNPCSAKKVYNTDTITNIVLIDLVLSVYKCCQHKAWHL